MTLKTATLIALICAALQSLIECGRFVTPSWRYIFNYGSIPYHFVNLAFYASLGLFFFTMYSKQQKG